MVALAWVRLSHARSGDAFVVWKLDRLGRTVRQLVAFAEDLKDRGVEFRSLTDGIDTSTPAGRFFFHMMAALAEMERDLIRERTAAGLAAARARGRLGGRRPKLTASQLPHARPLLADSSTTVTEVAATLKVARSTLYRAMAEHGAANRGGGSAGPGKTAASRRSPLAKRAGGSHRENEV